jgi:excinuclease ABC subunit C
MQQFYERATHVPREILLQHPIDSAPVLEEWLRGLRGGAVTIAVPRIGEKRKLVGMVADNAREALEEHKLRWMNDQQKTTGALKELQEALGLEQLPNRIECYDISNIQGTNAVGSMVVFERGKPKNSEYRRFKIKTVEGANDFAMMAEMLRRRFKRADAEDESFAALPDLIIVDGGKGQLHAAEDALAEVDRSNIPLVSLAKRLEEIFIPGRPESVLLPRTSQALYLVQRIRDEAHRFAITYHRTVRQKASVRSQIDSVPGIGDARRKALIKTFGSVRGIKAAGVEEIAAVPGMNRKLAETVKEHLH